MTSEPRTDVFRTVLLVALIGGLVVTSLWVLRPFLPALVWATTIVVATWPVMLAVQRRLGKRWLAVAVMTLALVIVFVVPLLAAIGTIVHHKDDIGAWVESLKTGRYDEPPTWVAGIPLVGETLDEAWRSLAAEGGVGHRIAPEMGTAVRWLIAQLGTAGTVLVQILLTIAITGVLYFNGESAARAILDFARRAGGQRGEDAVRLAGKSIRGVAMGVVVTALVQSILGGIGLVIAGVPLAPLLTAIMFLAAVAQIGAVPVLACAVIWLYVKDSNGWATALLVWTGIVGTLDNVLRPVLIKRGANLPLLLIFAGVVGGLMAFGLVGIFIGPIVLAVTWTLCTAWVAAGKSAGEAADVAGPAPVARAAESPEKRGGG